MLLLRNIKDSSFNIISLCAGMIVCAISILTMIGWKTTNLSLLLPLAISQPMQYISAMGFFISGLALIISLRFSYVSITLSFFIALLGLLTTIEYLFGVNFHLSQLFISDSNFALHHLIGKMAPNTALCFVLIGIVFFLDSSIDFKYKLQVQFITALLVLFLGLIAIFGHLSNLPFMQGWVPIMSACVQAILGIGLFIRIQRNSHTKIVQRDLFLPSVILCVGAIFFILSWQALLQKEFVKVSQQVQMDAYYTKGILKLNFDQNLKANERLYTRLLTQPPSELNDDIKSYLQDFNELSVISVNRNNHSWYDNVQSKFSKIETAFLLENCLKIFSQAKNSNSGDIAISAYRGGSDLCILQSKPGANLKLLAVINFQQYINYIVQSLENKGYLLTIYYNETPVYTTRNSIDSDLQDKWATHFAIAYGGLNFKVAIWPNKNLLQSYFSWSPALVFLAGLALTILFVFVIILLQSAKNTTDTLSEKIKQQDESKKKFNLLVNSTTNAMLLVNQDGLIDFANRTSSKLFGYTVQEMLNTPVEKYIPERYREGHINFRKNYMLAPTDRQMSFGNSLYLLTKSGEEIPVEISLSSIKYDDETVKVLCTIQDVRPLANYEKKLKQQAQLLQLQFDISNVLNGTKGIEAALQKCLNLMCPILGWPVGHVYIRKEAETELLEPTNIWYMENLEALKEFYDATMNTKIRIGVEFPGQVWSSGRTVLISDLNSAEEFYNFNRIKKCKDITLRAAISFPIFVNKEIIAVIELFDYKPRFFSHDNFFIFDVLREQISHVCERDQSQRNLHEAEERIRLILESVEEGIYGVDQEGKATFVNRAAAEMLGFDAKDLVGRNIHSLVHHSYINRQSYPFEKSPTYSTLSQNKVFHSGDDVFWRKDNTNFPAEYSSFPMTKNHELIGAVVTFRDKTERQHIEKVKNEFISVVSHELRTPLTSIHGSIALLESSLFSELSSDALDLIKIAKNNCTRLIRIINDILDIEKIETGKMEFKMENFDLNILIDEAIKAINSFAIKFSVTLQYERLEKNIIVYTDQDRFLQIMTNLISNAIKFSPKQGVVTVKVIFLDNKQIRVLVSDNGKGIPPEFESKIFQKFSQVDTSSTRSHEGTGLGLSITKAIIEKMGWKIGFKTKENVGTSFYFDFPIVSESDNILPKRQDLLLCTANNKSANLIENILVQQNFNVVKVSTAEKVFELILTTKFDGLILDLPNNDANSIEIINSIRAKQNYNNIPIILISLTKDNNFKTLNGGASNIIDWLEKPIDKARLNNAVLSLKERILGDRVHILHIEDDADLFKFLSTILQKDIIITNAKTCSDASHLLNTIKFDLVILDIKLPDGSGLDLLPAINYKNIPVVVFTAYELPGEYLNKVRTVLMKSKVTNEKIIHAIKTAVPTISKGVSEHG